ncbi:unnamed protein product [Paramecium octaurelia]|uniref:Transmembrane protein n=1 Tax=Paramecium octaurelia TaxID=43137 RepID=A0A8S1S6P6_PAROT|nr:unnamed protein product [Paramecium octaurelia]
MFNLILIFIVLDCQLVNTKNTILFPQNSFQIFQQQWVNCQNTSDIIKPQFDEPVRIPITYNKPLCLYDIFLFDLSEPMSFYYFTFNRTIENDDLLIINIDGESYTVTQETATDKFVLIRHKRLCSYNSIEFQLRSKSKDLGLINYLIFISQNQSADDYSQVLREQQQLLLQQQYFDIKKEYQITQYNLQTKNQEIINSILYYKGVLSFQGLEFISSCLYFDAYNFYDKMNCYNTKVGETIEFECKIDIARTESYSQIKNLSNLILSEYTFNFHTPCFNTFDQKMVFQTIQQISESNFSIASYVQEQKFGMQHQINLNYELQINQEKNPIEIRLNLNQSQICVEQFEEAVLTIKNNQGEIFKCELYNNNNCLSYNYNKCSFIVDFDFKDDVGYIFNLTAIIQRTDNSYPNFQFVLIDVELKGGPVFQEQDYNFVFVAILIFLYFGMPMICFLISTSTLKISLYNSWFREIYNYEQNALKT